MIEIVLGAVTKSIIGILVSSAVQQGKSHLEEKLNQDSTKKAFQKALSKAIDEYGKACLQIQLAKPLLKKEGVFSNLEIKNEIAKILLIDKKINYELVGKHWEEQAEIPPIVHVDFPKEVKELFQLIETQLKNTEVFQSVFKTKSLESIKTNVIISVDELVNINSKLLAMYEMQEKYLTQLIHALTVSSHNISKLIIDKSEYILEKTQDFVGRKWVMDKIDKFMANNSKGYFIINGQPGIGKTSLSAEIIKERGYVHHFNIRSENINKARDFYQNVCGQLIAHYNLEYESLPQNATENANFLTTTLLNEIREKGNSEPIILFIDALDEVDQNERKGVSNSLYLPDTLPKGVYIIATMRTDSDVQIPANDKEIIKIIHDSEENKSDIKEYLNKKLKMNGIQEYIKSQKTRNISFDKEFFVNTMMKKSDGNFMYIRYVLHDIANGKYVDEDLDSLPDGLQEYYKKHWKLMRDLDKNGWDNYKLPILAAITVSKKPISIDLISQFSRVSERHKIHRVLDEWGQFLYKQRYMFDEESVKVYSLYHESFHDFIASQGEVSEGRVDLNLAEDKLIDSYDWPEDFDDDDDESKQ